MGCIDPSVHCLFASIFFRIISLQLVLRHFPSCHVAVPGL